MSRVEASLSHSWPSSSENLEPRDGVHASGIIGGSVTCLPIEREGSMARPSAVDIGRLRNANWNRLLICPGIWEEPIIDAVMARRLNFDGDGQGPGRTRCRRRP